MVGWEETDAPAGRELSIPNGLADSAIGSDNRIDAAAITLRRGFRRRPPRPIDTRSNSLTPTAPFDRSDPTTNKLYLFYLI